MAWLYINNMPLYHVLAGVEFVFLFFFYRGLMKRLPLVILFLVTGFNIYDSLFVEDIHVFNSVGWSVNTFVLMIIGLVCLYHLYRHAEDYSTMQPQHSIFIIQCGLLIYFAGSLFTYLLGWYILSQDAIGFFHNGWLIQCVANIIRNLIVSYGIWSARLH